MRAGAGRRPARRRKLIVVFSPYRRLYAPLMHAVTDLQHAHPDRDIAVIIPELVGDALVSLSPAQPDGVLIKAYLLLQRLPRVVVINVPWYLAE